VSGRKKKVRRKKESTSFTLKKTIGNATMTIGTCLTAVGRSKNKKKVAGGGRVRGERKGTKKEKL